MKADPKGVLEGPHFLDGDHAACEGALAAGCRFVAGYPITPSTEVVERFARRIPMVGGVFIQMEDELASSIAISGAVWAGVKAMTVTSGPGFSLMMEHIGFAAMTETPCVFVDVQRGGPSTGLPTLPSQGDMMQARFGSHGDYETIAISPNSPQECFDLMIKAFNLSEEYRVPVMFMMDECVGHLTERVVIPPAGEIEIYPRRWSKAAPGEYLPYQSNGNYVPEITRAGLGHKFHVTGLTHDERGYPSVSVDAQKKLMERLIHKIRDHREKLADFDETDLDEAEVVLITYGVTSRVAYRAMEMAREEGIQVGHVRLKVVWPFPSFLVDRLADRIKGFVVPELNYGQVALEVERFVGGRCKTILVPHAGGTVHDPEVIRQAIAEAAK